MPRYSFRVRPHVQPFNDSSRRYSWPTKSFFPPIPEARHRAGKDANVDLCEGFPTHLLSRIQVVMKTGAGDHIKAKNHLATVTSCIENLIVVSDLAEDIGSHTTVDVLANLPPSYHTRNPAEFEAYAEIQQAHTNGKLVSLTKPGQRLDRFKFLPMIEKAFAMRPSADWYVFIETDIYYFWDTLFRLLDQIDPSELHYLGSPAPKKGYPVPYFGYGGASIVLSHGLVERLILGEKDTESHVADNRTTSEPLIEKYQELISFDPCGDASLSTIIREQTGARLESLHPIIAGYEVDKIKVNQEQWCIPLLSLHHVQPEQMARLWQWERKRPYNEDPILHSTLLPYTNPTLTRTNSTRDLWDNFSIHPPPSSSDPPNQNTPSAHESPSHCASACAADPDCLQYSYTYASSDDPGACRLGRYVHGGKAVEFAMNGYDKNKDKNIDGGEEGERPTMSGWDVEKIAKLGFYGDGDGDGMAESADGRYKIPVGNGRDVSASCPNAVWVRPETWRDGEGEGSFPSWHGRVDW
ncbi:MAG: hypothetical protein Q9227_004335 [Pyrenula ochraceoflavens]